MENRNFQLDNEWNMIHYPEKPTGFGILILGDERHFVDARNSFWLQNEGKLSIIEKFKQSGYTIFSSNLYGRNWGSDQASDLAEKLYHYVMRTEILNKKIHICAEGMGALTAIKLMKRLTGQLRSVVFLNPILSLKTHLEQEREHKFFFKKLSKELETAYQCRFTELEDKMANHKEELSLNREIPIKMIHVLNGGRSYNQTKHNLSLIKQDVEHHKIESSLILPEKKQQLGTMMVKFFNRHEKVL
jgi:predicted alpha/beta hydrolase family esterase